MYKALRKRKLCRKCGESFSARHISRHEEQCRKVIDSESDTDTDNMLLSNQDREQYSIKPNSSENSNHGKVNNTFANIEEEDNVFFEESEHIEISSSDTSSSCDEFSNAGSDIEPESNNENDSNDEATANIKYSQWKYIFQWILSFIFVWQSTYCISNAAVTMLMKFMRALCSCIMAVISDVHVCLDELSLKSAKKRMFGKSHDFKEYVVCPRCCSLYSFNDCVLNVEGSQVSKKCPYIEFQNHKQKHRRKMCGEILLKQKHLVCGGKKLIPRYKYCYKSLKETFAYFVKKQNFEQLCESWSNRVSKNGLASDVYDGRIWSNLLDCSGKKFFEQKGNYGLILNVDWFQPFKYVTYSVGVIYIAFLNLPRTERYKKENILIVGIIPGMKKEPPTNTLLSPLIDELLEAWTPGLKLYSFNSTNTLKTFRLALLCCACDIPACRKVCGFLGHTANRGCSRCFKEFPGAVGEKNYGGFDRQHWAARDKSTHLKHINTIQLATSKTDKNALESKYGCRYSVLLKLPYFDPIRMGVIDPMHNLFLGTAKHMIRVWKETRILTDDIFSSMQEKVDSVHCPADIGRLPHKINSGFTGFTADQLKNWTIIFSMYALREYLPKNHLLCWQKFVLACRILCCKVISQEDIELVDRLLMCFCTNFEKLYGQNRVTPNMHLHCHLAECLKDFGPVYGFWLFSFERENGILGNYPNNRKTIESQLMKKYLYDFTSMDIVYPSDFHTVFMPIMNYLKLQQSTSRGTLGSDQSASEYWLQAIPFSGRNCVITSVQWSVSQDIVDSTIASRKPGSLSQAEQMDLRNMYSIIYNLQSETECNQSLNLYPSCYYTSQVKVLNSRLGSLKSRTVRSSCIVAYWSDNTGNNTLENTELRPRPGKIQKFIIHSIKLNSDSYTHILAKVQWYMSLSQNMEKNFANISPLSVWSSMAVQVGPASYIPVQRIKAKYVSANETHHGVEVLFVCPRERSIL